jgi:hypothetical protein
MRPEARGVFVKSMGIGSIVLAIVPAIAVASAVELVAVKARPVCEKVAKFFGERLAPDQELLNTVEWSPVELQGLGPKLRRCSSLDKALIDLDNDGTKDLVVKTTFCMKGVPSDSFYSFPADSTVLEQASWQDLSPLLATADKFERTGGMYPLTSLRVESAAVPPPLTTVFTVHPFILDGVAYLSVTDAKQDWMAIAKYLGGERFEDQCYLKSRRSF